MLPASDYATIGVLIPVVLAMSGAMLLITHLLGPKRKGPIKDSTYESGMTPVTDARRRFNVRFYLVAVMYVVFSVEVVFLYPWAVVFPQFRQQLSAAQAGGEAASGELATWAAGLAAAGYSPAYMFGAALIFFALLAVGLAYEWRKGVFKWD